MAYKFHEHYKHKLLHSFPARNQGTVEEQKQKGCFKQSKQAIFGAHIART